MDQYPDENEEFELQYQDELELLQDMPPDGEDLFQPIAAHNKPPLNSTKTTPAANNLVDSFPSPQFSQISYGENDTDNALAPVNRRLFGTPKVAQRISSTPLVTKQQLAPIAEVISLTPVEEVPNAIAAEELQNLGLRSKRRLERDLFGDIDDLYYNNETYEDPIAKKARTEEERDLEAIEKILDTRRRLREASQSLHKDNLSRLQALHTYKMQNLSYTVPHWPFLVLQRGDSQRIYVRFHGKDFEQRALDTVQARPSYGSLLGEAKQQVWAGANEIVLRRASAATAPETAAGATEVALAAPVSRDGDRLWVEKYKPRKYIDLLSDEMTNRSLLYWLKMWDKVVFGREFKKKPEITNSIGLNSFNKRTGKFESNGGWRPRKSRQADLNTNVDELGRPVQKVALLCGPPGLGKTTLAHTIARHAGYSVREINASDDRSPEAFKLALENGTQMSSVLNEQKRPNCIILDEIDGAPRQSIEFLVKFVTDNAVSKAGTKAKGKGQRNILKRPIICICNDVYDPALRPLRQIAFVVTFPPIDTARLTERLVQIAHRERLKTDFGALFALSEKSGNDVRCCISTMQFFNAQRKMLRLNDVLNNNLGQKDRHQGLFEVWNAIFRIQRPKKQLITAGTEESQVTMTDMSVTTRVRNVLDIVHSGGDYERLMQGVYENYLMQKMPDPNMNGIVEAMQWFCFSDELQQQINHRQNYTVYPYLQFGFVIWHLLFASLAWPKINFPTRGFEFRQKSTTQRNIFQSFRKGICSGAVGMGQGYTVLVETVPFLKRILSPQLRSVALQLLSTKEQNDLRHTIEVMVDLGITYTQTKSADGSFTFQMEPDLDVMAQFPGFPGITLSYFGRQLIAREVELERIRRATPKQSEREHAAPKRRVNKEVAAKQLPNHLQRLQPKRLDKNANAMAAKEVVSKDFFGRIHRKTSAVTSSEENAKTDPIVKSPIWYRYKEGFNNAVRKDIHMNELL